MPSFSRFVPSAHKVLSVGHAVLWCIVMLVWVVAWQTVHAPIHPEFNNAKHFIGAVDVLVYLNVDDFSWRLAINVAHWFNADIGLVCTLSFSGLILLAGSLQWFLIGRLIQWTFAKYGPRLAKYLTVAVILWTCSFALLWAVR
jgi:hypothetical protein